MTLAPELAARVEFRADVIAGLSRHPRSLPCKYLYDARGSALFDRICTLDAYYPTRTEREILRRSARAIAGRVGRRVRVVEPGPGSGEKAVLLLEALDAPAAYVPIDVSASFLAACCARVRARFPRLAIHPVEADFTAPVRLPPDDGAASTLVFFPGSTLGNFEEADAVALLRSFAATAGPGGAVLLGVDLDKDPSVLERAYDDELGVTAAFNRNLLERIGRQLDATVDASAFEHRARYDRTHRRVELSLVATRPTVLSVGALRVPFAPGEAIVTEHSHKYRLCDVIALSRRAGLSLERAFFDPRGAMALCLLRAGA